MKVKDTFAAAMKSISFAWRTNRRIFLLLIFLNIFQGSIVYLQFSSFAFIVDEIIRLKEVAGSLDRLILSSFTLGCSFLLPSIVGNVAGYYRNSFRLEQSLQFDLYRVDKQASLDIGTIESSLYQNLLQGASEWGIKGVHSLQDFVLISATSFASILTSMVVLWLINKWLVLLAILAACPIYFFYRQYSLRVFRVRWFSVEDRRIIADRISHFEDLYKAVDVILLKLKGWFKDQIKDRMNEYNKRILALEVQKSISYSFLSLWYLIFLFAAIALMTREAIFGGIEVGSLLIAFSTYTRFYQTINGYIESISLTEESARYAARWFELFDLKPKIVSKNGIPKSTFPNPPLIEFRNVSFRYPSETKENPLVLKNLSFSIVPGEKVAIIGVNGSGKTTLIKLLCRIYDPISGSVHINGVNLKDIRLEDWQDALGVLFQDFPTYNLTIRESIGIGKISDPMDDIKLQQASIFSGVEDFVGTFQDKYDQLIWKGFKNGTDLSKGEHQRLALARMLYRNAVITILDEPTASIDTLTEEKIFANIEKNMSGKTVVLITHRFSSLKNADKILVLENGEIIGQGSHSTLMQSSTRYAELYVTQAKRYLRVD